MHHTRPVATLRVGQHLAVRVEKRVCWREREHAGTGLLLDGEGEDGVGVGIRHGQLVTDHGVGQHGSDQREVAGGVGEGWRFVHIHKHHRHRARRGRSVHVAHRHAQTPRLGLRRVLEVQFTLHEQAARRALHAEPLVDRRHGELQRLPHITRVRISRVETGRQETVLRSVLLHVQHRRLCVKHGSLVDVHHLDGEHAEHAGGGVVLGGDGGGCEGEHVHGDGLVVHVLDHLHLRRRGVQRNEHEVARHEREVLLERHRGEELRVLQLQRAVLQHRVNGRVLHDGTRDRVYDGNNRCVRQRFNDHRRVRAQSVVAGNHVKRHREGSSLESVLHHQRVAILRYGNHLERHMDGFRVNGQLILLRVRDEEGRADGRADGCGDCDEDGGR